MTPKQKLLELADQLEESAKREMEMPEALRAIVLAETATEVAASLRALASQGGDDGD
jgi:hypothetical protein